MTIDLRSDTVTLPTDAMREAMRRAEVGDDVYAEDPTVRRLEALAATWLGKEAALFVPSGTMGNLVAVLAHAGRGDAVIVEDDSHIRRREAVGMAFIAGVVLRPITGERGVLTPGHLARLVTEVATDGPAARLVSLENTHHLHGGAMTAQQVDEVCALARESGLRVHVDGARMFNAAVAQGVEPAALVRAADSVMFCVSKGLSAPVGSLLVGTAAMVERARRLRAHLGGAMRQAGILAAAALVALETMVDRLAEDHATARRLADALGRLPGVQIEPVPIPTNMVAVRIDNAPAMVRGLAERGVLCHASGDTRIRLVTHRHISARDVDAVIEIFSHARSSAAGKS